MDALSMRAPYENLKHDADASVEMVNFEDEALRGIESDKSSVFPYRNASNSSSPSLGSPTKNCSLSTLILSCSVAAGVQFGWALQLSLLTAYIQTTCILLVYLALWTYHRHWILDWGHQRTLQHVQRKGPARGLLADLAGPDQRNSANAIFCTWMAIGNILGFSSGSSGKWHSWFPFLTSRACCEACGNLKAAFLVAVIFLMFCTMVTLYFAKEVPLAPKQHLRLSDVDPFLEDHQAQQHGLDHSESQALKNAVDHKVGNRLEHVFELDTNEKKSNSTVEEDQVESFSNSPSAVLVNLLTSLRHLPLGMHSVLIVMALTWLSWFPFFLFDTDWMGREVYHGDPKGNASEIRAYDEGVREGAFGLILNSVVLGISSFFIEPMCRSIGSKFVWAVSNFIVFACMAGTAIITFISLEESRGTDNAVGGNEAIKTASLVVFAILGLPLAITYSVPFSVTADLTADSGGGQGLAIGVLNLAIVIPQMIVSLGAGPWDALFGGGNVPAFVLASWSALAAGIIATLKLPTPSNSYTPIGFHVG